MREYFDYEGTSTGEYRSGLYVTYCEKEYPAVYLGVGRFILYSDYPDENFTFPAQDGRYLLQTDLRDEYLTRACEIHMVGIIKECFESVMIHDILDEGILISTNNSQLGFQLGLTLMQGFGFVGLVDKSTLVGIYEERDYLWNPELGIYSTFCQAVGAMGDASWFLDKDRITQLYMTKETGAS